MKKQILLYLGLFGLMFNQTSHAQCVPSCTNYIAAPISYSLFPVGSTIPASSFTNPSSLLSNPDDGVTSLIPIGFAFNFYCTSYTDLWICTNGFIQFNNGLPGTSIGYADPVQTFPSVTAPNAMVALCQTDLDYTNMSTYNSSISYTTVGTAPNRMFVATYSNVPGFGSSSLNTGQIVLYETTNIIEIHSYSITNSNTSYATSTQGIENATGTLGTAVPGCNNSVWTASNTAYRFSPYDIAPPTGITGDAAICQGLSATYQTTVASGVLSVDWYAPAGWLGAGNTGINSSNTFTIMSSGAMSVTATYSCGTSLPVTFVVNAIPAPTISYVAVYPSTVCSANNNVVITVSGASDYTLYPGGYITTAGTAFTVTPTATTEYTLMGTDATNCPSYNQPVTNVSVNPTPEITVNSGSICAGQGFTMEPSGGVTYTYTGSSNSPYVNPPAGVFNYTVNSTVDGCIGIPAICSLTVYSMPTTNAIATKTNVCKTDHITVYASGAQNYLWNTGATTSVTILNFSNYLGMTVFSVTGSNEGGCAKTATLQFYVNACVGLEERTSVNNLIVYPNPSNGEFTVEMNNNGLEKTITLTDLTGRVVMTNKTASDKIDFDINELNSGIYFLKLESENEKQTIKVVKE